MDEIVLTLPRERPFLGVAHLVLGGLAARLNLTYEHLEDLQLALDTLLAQRDQGDVTVRLRVGGDAIEAQVGPFGGSLRSELEREAGADVGLRRILDTVTDRIELADENGGTWVTVAKSVNGAGREAVDGV